MRKMQDSMHAHLVLEDGTTFGGRSVGSPGTAAGEICFTTAMAGYEEAVTDPSYAGQVLVFSYPLVGNYGIDPGRRESSRAQTRGVVMRRVRPAWAAWLADEGVPALDDVDTRALVRRIRTEGAMRCALGTAEPVELQRLALSEPPLAGQTLAAEAGTPVPFVFGSGPRVVVLDLGCKRSILRRLAASGLEAYVVPADTPADEILALDPAAVLVSNGPGDPAAAVDQVEAVGELLGRVRLFGICLGHQVVALALGMRTFKLPFGHRGANHPVRERGSSRVLVTTQNHGYAVEASDAAEVSHLSLNDATVEGLEGEDVTTLQFHPEAAPGPLDALPFFDRLAAACRSAPTFAAS
jgi:carbamoyl-phosphate synthase small subunit